MAHKSLSLAAAVALAWSASSAFAGGFALPTLPPNLQFPAETSTATKGATPQSLICIESATASLSSADTCSTSAEK